MRSGHGRTEYPVLQTKLYPLLGKPRVRRKIFAGDHFSPGIGPERRFHVIVGNVGDWPFATIFALGS